MGSGGVADGCGQFLRCLIVAVNFLLLVVSIILVAAISYSFAMMKQGAQLAPDESMTGALLLTLTIPVLSMIISFLGCCGAIRESKCMLIIYSVIVGLLIVLFVVAFVIMLVYKNKFKNLNDTIKKEMKDSIKEYEPTPDNPWDFFQSNLQCCGVDGPADWGLAYKQIPSSCYPVQAGKLTAQPYPRGCYNLIQDYITYYSQIFIGCIVALTVFMMISICAVCTLVKSINSYSEMA